MGQGSPTKIDYGKKSGTLILASPLEDLVLVCTNFGTARGRAGSQPEGIPCRLGDILPILGSSRDFMRQAELPQRRKKMAKLPRRCDESVDSQ